ncbi:hypothetical protein [Streptomyces sp. NPDC058045]
MSTAASAMRASVLLGDGHGARAMLPMREAARTRHERQPVSGGQQAS